MAYSIVRWTGTFTVAIALTGCAGMKFARKPPQDPGDGPFTLLLHDQPCQIYSSRIVEYNIVGMPTAQTLLTLSPPARSHGWLSTSIESAEPWQFLPGPLDGSITTWDIIRAANNSMEADDRPRERHWWWLVSMEPLRLAACDAPQVLPEFGDWSLGATDGWCSLVREDALRREVEAIVTYRGPMLSPVPTGIDDARFVQSQLEIEMLAGGELTIGGLMERITRQE